MIESPRIKSDDGVDEEIRQEVENIHSQIIGPSEEDLVGLDDVLLDNSKDFESSQSFLRRSVEYIVDFLKKPTKKARITLGLLAFFGGAGYLGRDEIISYGSQVIIQNPLTMDYTERDFQKGHMIKPGQEVAPKDIDIIPPLKESEGQDFSLQIKDIKINVYDGIYGLKGEDSHGDLGPKIEIQDEILKNILEQNSNNVGDAENEPAFREFLHNQIESYLNSKGDKYRLEGFNRGDIGTFVDMIVKIIDQNLKYDKRTSSWLSPTSDGRLKLKIGDSNPIEAFHSTDGRPVDKLLMEDHVGTCRQFSDCTQLVAKEIKEMYPDKFQNIYIVSHLNAYIWHVYNLGFVVRNAKQGQELDAFEFDPQTNQTGAPAYELIKMMRERGIINQTEYFDSLKKFLNTPKAHEESEDIFAMVESAERENRPDVIEAAKNMFIRKTEFKSLQLLREKGLVNDDDYTKAILKSLQDQDFILNETIEQAMTFAKEHPQEREAINDALLVIVKNPDFQKIGSNVYFETLLKMKNEKLLSNDEYFKIGNKVYEDHSWNIDDGKFLEFLFDHEEYLPLVKHYIVRDMSWSVKFPINLIEEYHDADGEYSSWEKKDFLEQPIKNMDNTIENNQKYINKYMELKVEDLAKKSELDFIANMAVLRQHINTHDR